MAKVRVSTTVDQELLDEARACVAGARDSTLVERALRALLASERAAQIDREIDEGYERIPYDTPDEWGSLADFHAGVREAKSASAAR